MEKSMPTAPPNGLVAHRLDGEFLDENFVDIHPPLTAQQATIEADRCFYCYDAPCITACPTGIDIPSFIQRIATNDLSSSAKRIFEQNIFGGMCARVCPTETLCEEACVRNLGEQKPVKIGLLQRYATDHAMMHDEQYFTRAAATGKTVAVVGAGPAGLACAHRLALLGHAVKVYERRPKSGGLNEYGIAAYKVVDEFAQRELEYILAIGGIEVVHGKSLGDDLTLQDLRGAHDAVFLALGLGGFRQLGLDNEQMTGVSSALTFIENLRQTADKADVQVGRCVIVIGGGMTAVDAASQALRLGAEEATLVYRRGPQQQAASAKEIKFVQTTGARVRYWAQPKRIIGNGAVVAMEFEYTADESGKLVGTGDTYELPADMVLIAAGQTLVPEASGYAGVLEVAAGKIVVNAEGGTGLAGVWAGGDCIKSGEDLTVSAVEDGKVAAHAINNYLAETN